MWFMPSYGRPHRMHELATLNMPDNLLVVLTADDPALPNYQDNMSFKHVVAPAGSRLGDLKRWIFAQYPDESFYSIIGDDVHPGLGNPWAKLEQAAASRFVAVASGGPRGNAIGAGGVCLGGELVRVMGNLAPAGFKHNFVDNIWNDVALEFDLLRFIPDAVIEHRHPCFGTGEWDDTYRRGMEFFADDQRRYEEWLASDDRKQMNERIRAFMVPCTACR